MRLQYMLSPPKDGSAQRDHHLHTSGKAWQHLPPQLNDIAETLSYRPFGYTSNP